MTVIRRSRPLVAVLLALYPGLGHIYLREWLRAVLWFGLINMSSLFLVPSEARPTELSWDAMVAAGQQIPTGVVAVVFGITILSMVDAYLLATRTTASSDDPDVDSCPVCGKQLDPELSFCHWCTSRVVEDGSANG